MRGIKINVDGSFEEIPISEITNELLSAGDIDNRYCVQERYDFIDERLYILGMLDLDEPFNNYEFQFTTLTGPAYVFTMDLNQNFINLTIEEFRNFYEQVDNILSEDDESLDTYDYTDDFIIDDRYLA